MIRRCLLTSSLSRSSQFASSSALLSATVTTRQPRTFATTAETEHDEPNAAGKFDADHQRRQMAEHERFMHFVSHDNFVEYVNCTPQHLCSASRIDLLRERDPKAMQKAQGRGLVATADIRAGAVIASAPLLASGIYADRLIRRAQTELIESVHEDKGTKKRDARSLSNPSAPASGSVLPPELRMALTIMWGTLPAPSSIVRVAHEKSGIEDEYVAMQAHLALCLAAERCNEESVYTSYFESLPHPAVDDKRILSVYDGFLDHDADPYGGLCHDYNEFLRGLREEWLRNAVILTRKDAKEIFLPPMKLIIWAWRTVLSRQMALPIFGKPHISSDEKDILQPSLHGASHQTHFVNWQMLHSDEPEATLFPTLVPFLDLVDHGVSNVRIDVVTREVSVPSLPSEYREDAAGGEGENPFLKNIEKRNAEKEAELTFMVREAKQSFDDKVNSSKATRGVLHRISEAVNDALPPVLGGRRGKKETAAYVQLQATTDIKAGTELNLRFSAEDDDHSFVLYRFGFFPYVS